VQVLVGTYTELPAPEIAHGRGIVRCSLHDGELAELKVIMAIPNPSYLAPSPDGERLYAVSETLDALAEPSGSIHAFVCRDDGGLDLLGSCPSGGIGPCHLAASPDGHFVLAANYGSGTIAALAVDPHGIGPVASVVAHTPPPAHPHMIAFDPLTERVVVPDLGLDAVLVYELDHAGQLAERADLRVGLPTGSGPRHVVFHPNADTAFVVTEIASTLVLLRRENGVLTVAGSVSTLRHDDPTSRAGAVRLSPDGRHVFVTNRGPAGGSVAMLRYDEDRDTVVLVALESTHGRHPRDCALTPDGRYLLVANQESDTVGVFAVDGEHETLSYMSSLAIATPACVLPLTQ